MTLILGILLTSIASATLLGTFKQNQNIPLIQTCPDCTYNKITYIQKPDGAILNFNVEMDKDGTFYNWTLDSNYTDQIGIYLINGIGDIGGTEDTWYYDFDVTPSGFIDTLGFYIVLLVVLGGIVILGFSINEAWFVVLGGLGFIMLGIYSINFGVVGFRDMFMTWGLGLFEIAVGAILSIGAGIQKLYYD